MEQLMKVLHIGHKWIREVICDCKVPTRFKGEFYLTTILPTMIVNDGWSSRDEVKVEYQK